ncbi:hypothetical protein Bbelb_294500 [Branchiostoma belcheri]|nr:hypothetical protein Bbelb_294500 [Branchiostoma belcheri]
MALGEGDTVLPQTPLKLIKPPLPDPDEEKEDSKRDERPKNCLFSEQTLGKGPQRRQDVSLLCTPEKSVCCTRNVTRSANSKLLNRAQNRFSPAVRTKTIGIPEGSVCGLLTVLASRDVYNPQKEARRASQFTQASGEALYYHLGRQSATCVPSAPHVRRHRARSLGKSAQVCFAPLRVLGLAQWHTVTQGKGVSLAGVVNLVRHGDYGRSILTEHYSSVHRTAMCACVYECTPDGGTLSSIYDLSASPCVWSPGDGDLCRLHVCQSNPVRGRTYERWFPGTANIICDDGMCWGDSMSSLVEGEHRRSLGAIGDESDGDACKNMPSFAMHKMAGIAPY